MHDPLARNLLESQRFLRPFQPSTTHRADGSSWPRWRDTWKNTVGYFRALARGGEGKSMMHIATHMDVRRQRIERFIRDSPWDPEAIEAELNQNPPAAFQGPTAQLLLDGMGIPKKGKHSVGVARQWCGETGKIDNCQVVVNLTLTRPGDQANRDQVTWPLGSRLYLTKQWAGVDDAYDDAGQAAFFQELREATGVPDEVAFRSKPEIGLGLVRRALDAGIEHRCTNADAGFGRDGGFRQQLRAWQEPYVVGVKPSELRVIPADTVLEEPGPNGQRGPNPKHPRYPKGVDPVSPLEIAERADEEDAWEEIVFAQGTKGPLSSLFYRERVRTVGKVQKRWVTDEVAWLLLEKREGEIKAYVCWGVDQVTDAPGDDAPERLSLGELAGIAHGRWAIERFHQDIKDTLGAKEFQGRSWGGFHRHMAMVLLAHAFIATLRVEEGASAVAGLPSFEAVVHQVTWERGVQLLMREEPVDRGRAEELTSELYREWFATRVNPGK